MDEFSFSALSRFPDPEADNLFAADSADRLILDEAAEAIASAGPGRVVVIGDDYGALTLGAAALHGATGIRVHQDPLRGEHALAANARRFGLSDAYTSLDAVPELVANASVVLLRMPRSLHALAFFADLIADFASPEVAVFAGGRVKHMALSMNDVLAGRFGSVSASLARQKSRVIRAEAPLGRPSQPTVPDMAGPAVAVRREFHADLGLWVCAVGGVFADTKIDIGTRFLLTFLDEIDAVETPAGPFRAIDLGCGTGILATAFAVANPGAEVIASDHSAAAVRSASLTASANDVAQRVTAVRDDALFSQPDSSADLVLLNPPFHSGSTVHTGLASALFKDAARVLRPGGQLWTVFNSPLGYRPELRRVVGPTVEVGRNSKFVVTRSVKAATPSTKPAESPAEVA